MPEYITKEQAYLCMLEHWDGDMLPGDYDDYLREIPPAADVAPVVRCKDCRFRKKREPLTGFKYFECILDGSQAVDPDFFCAHGERLDGGGND